MSRFRDMRLYSGSSNPQIAEKIANNLCEELGNIHVDNFADGEIQVQINQTVRGMDVFLVQSTCRPVNEHLMELLLMIDAAQRASAARITTVIPYFGYARQDRKDRPRVPISSKLVANMIEEAGADRVLTMHLHADQIQGFFDIPVDHLYSAPIILNHFDNKADPNQSIIVSPDAGSVARSRALAKRLDFGLAIIDKRRPEPNQSKVAHLIGDVDGQHCIIVDDMIDTGGTLCEAAETIDDAGAKSVTAFATHPILSDPAVERLQEAPLDDVIVCNSIPLQPKARDTDKIKVLDSSTMLARALNCIHEEKSIKKLFV